MTQVRRAREKVSRKIDGRVYLFHLDKPIGSEKHQAQHYLGWTPRTADERLQDHKAGKGARFTQVANELGIGYHIVRDWPGNRDIENELKLHAPKRLCPECYPGAKTPGIVQKAIKREQRSKYYRARKEALKEVMKREPTRAERQKYGAEAAANFASGLLSQGKSLEQIRDMAHEATAGKPSDYTAGWDRQIDSDLAMARELERQDEEASTRAEEAPPVESYRAQLTALSDREAPSWLPTPAELRERPAYTEREAG